MTSTFTIANPTDANDGSYTCQFVFSNSENPDTTGTVDVECKFRGYNPPHN